MLKSTGIYRVLMIVLSGIYVCQAVGQPDRWQQKVMYKMDIDFNTEKHQYTGKQHLVYFNNSPDTLNRVFYHLYFNAFQPGSGMDVRSRTIADPDGRISDRISRLKPDEIGYIKVNNLLQDNKPLRYQVEGTILEVVLDHPLLPGRQTTLDMDYEAQVPLQIRRSGRSSAEGIDYSMSQWYPKLCEYDYQGWHANPYIGREFYGVWGDFDVTISMDKDYVIGASGYLQNPDEIGYGYESEGVKVKHKGKKLSWHFIAPNVHDFVWGADRDYKHGVFVRKNGMVIHTFYQPGMNADSWTRLPEIMDKVFDYADEHLGVYPYKQYSFIQGGDGGMEYPMATLITGERSLVSLVGVSTHELMHSWYQMLLGTNESLYAWMDEGFADYFASDVMNFLRRQQFIPGNPVPNPHAGAISSYVGFSQSGLEEPMNTHADHFVTNAGYSVGSYVKGEVLLVQLQYIIGKQAFDKGMLQYYYSWRYKHPNENDFIRVMEKTSDLELDWFKEYFVHTTHTIDYAVKSVDVLGDSSVIVLDKLGYMPMPLDVEITYTDGSRDLYNIALDLMRGNKPSEREEVKYEILPDWQWTNPSYRFAIPADKGKISSVQIDPSGRLADVKPANNLYKVNP